MSSEIIFLYDGECPFCNHFARLIELKSSIPSLTICDGRKNLAKLSILYKKGYDLNKGAILLIDEKIYHGSEAINWICCQIKEADDSLLDFLRIIFKSKKRSNLIFPLLLWARRLSLTLKGKVWKPVSENNHFTK